MVRIRLFAHIWPALLPLALSLVGVLKNSLIFLGVAVLAVFMLAAILPCFRHQQGLGVFMMTFLAGIPWNIKLILYLFPNETSAAAMAKFAVVSAFLTLSLFGTEEIIMCLFARLIWRHQKEYVDESKPDIPFELFGDYEQEPTIRTGFEDGTEFVLEDPGNH